MLEVRWLVRYYALVFHPGRERKLYATGIVRGYWKEKALFGQETGIFWGYLSDTRWERCKIFVAGARGRWQGKPAGAHPIPRAGYGFSRAGAGRHVASRIR